MDWLGLISVDPTVRGGQPCIKGTRITVDDVLESLAGGMSGDQILRDFPDLNRESIRAVLAFAAVRNRQEGYPQDRLRGTVEVHGDVVGPVLPAEAWDAEASGRRRGS